MHGFGETKKSKDPPIFDKKNMENPWLPVDFSGFSLDHSRCPHLRQNGIWLPPEEPVVEDQWQKSYKLKKMIERGEMPLSRASVDVARLSRAYTTTTTTTTMTTTTNTTTTLLLLLRRLLLLILLYYDDDDDDDYYYYY